MISIRSFRDLLRLFFIFKYEVKLTVIATFVIIVLGAFLLPNRYESTAALLVKPGRDTSTLPIEISDRASAVIPAANRDPILDEERMLAGQPIARLVAEKYLDELSRLPQKQGVLASIKNLVKSAVTSIVDIIRGFLQLVGLTEKQSPVDRLAEKLMKNFTVTHATGSSVMEINFKWDDPRAAQQVVSYWIELYQQQRTINLGRKSLYEFYENEGKDTQARIASYKQQIQDHLNELGAVSITERLNDVSRNINDLKGENLNTIRSIASTQAGLDALAKQMKGISKTISISQEVAPNPEVDDLNQRINTKLVERQELLRSYKDTAPPVRALDDAIENLRGLAKALPARVNRTDNMAPNPIYVRLQNSYADQQASLNRLKSQADNQKTQLAKLEQDRVKAMAIEPELSRLQRELATTETNYTLYSTSMEKARIDRELDASQISNIAVIEQATLKPERIFPKSLMMLLLAIPISIAVGLLALYFFYLLDQRVHDGDKIEGRYGIKVWTTLPDTSANKGPQGSSVFTASLYRLYGVLPLKQVAEKGLALGVTSARRGEGVSFVTEQLRQLLTERGHSVRVNEKGPTAPGEILLLEASGFFSNQEAFVTLLDADLIVMVVEAETTTVPVLENALSILNTAFKHVDGIIVNKRRFEIPAKVLQWLSRIRSHA